MKRPIPLGLQGSLEYDTEVIRFSYSSMTTPSQQFDYNMRTRERNLLKTQEVPSGHEPDDYITRRVMAPSHDGTLVPVSLLYRKDTPLDGSAPCLLYGYGSYGMAIPASFNTNCLSLVDRGFVYAIAHIRGGKDKGFAWYEAGKREHKVNTFLDFIAAADYLAAENFTSFQNIVAQGGSAGGMLMGAVANMAPDRFGAIIAAVPFVDVLNTMLDDTLPLTPPGMAGMGQPDRIEDGLRNDCRLFALRQCERAGLSADTCHRWTDGSSGDLLGAGEMGGQAARHQDRRCADPLQDQHGGRPCRGVRKVPASGGSRLRICLCAQGDRKGRLRPAARLTIRLADKKIQRRMGVSA